MFFDIKWHDVPSFIAWFLAICSYPLLWLFSIPPVDSMHWCIVFVIEEKQCTVFKFNDSERSIWQRIWALSMWNSISVVIEEKQWIFYCFFFHFELVLFHLLWTHVFCKMGFLLSLNFLDFLSDLFRHESYWIFFLNMKRFFLSKNFLVWKDYKFNCF